MNEEKNIFEAFFEYDWYLEFKNLTSNYLHRKSMIRREIYNGIKRNGKEVILDIGSGISPVIDETGAGALLGDFSSSAVSFMKKRGINCQHLDVTDMNLKDASVDVIVCSEVLEHVKEDKKAVREMRRVLKDDGMLVVTVPIYKHYWLKDDELVGHLRRYDPKKFIEKLEDAGFEILKKKMIGSLTERITTFVITTLFLSKAGFSGAKKTPPKFIRHLLSLYKVANIVWSKILLFTAAIAHPKLSSILLVKCKKK